MDAASELQELLKRVLAVSSRDVSAQMLVGSVVFAAGARNYGDIVLSVPTDADFVAQHLELLLDGRFVVAGGVPPTSDLAYRPCDWYCGDASGIPIALGVVQNPSTYTPSAVFELLESSGRTFQSGPLNVAWACSTRQNSARWYWTSAQRGCVVFQCGRKLARGSRATVRITPLFFFGPGATGGTVNEFRVTACLSGYYWRG